ncbi:phosphoribosylanthranilate isomerase [Leptospira sp. WS92.C1]
MNTTSPQKPKVKICGIRDLQTAQVCKEEGADYIGLNFAPSSPRNISVSDAQKIVELIRSQNGSPEIVFLFYKNSPEEIQSIRSILDHDLVQWIWDDPKLTSVNREELLGPRQICSYRISAPVSNKDLQFLPGEFLILDSDSREAGGGTGKIFNWDFISGIERRFLLAGGLNPENVISAIQAVKPFGVDVASGVESSPGIKDISKIIQFIRNAKSAL